VRKADVRRLTAAAVAALDPKIDPLPLEDEPRLDPLNCNAVDMGIQGKHSASMSMASLKVE